MCVCVCRAREASARDKGAAAEAKDKEEEMQGNTSKLHKQIDKAIAERNSAEGRSQRSAASLLKVKADLASLEIKLQVWAACPLVQCAQWELPFCPSLSPCATALQAALRICQSALQVLHDSLVLPVLWILLTASCTSTLCCQSVASHPSACWLSSVFCGCTLPCILHKFRWAWAGACDARSAWLGGGNTCLYSSQLKHNACHKQ